MDSLTPPTLMISAAAAKRIAAIQAIEGKRNSIFRITVSGGGCSGFQYGFALDDKINPEDAVFEREGVKVVVDDVSLELVKGSEVTWVEDLVGSYFKMTNPNAKSSCGCGTSFSI
ncbi:MAG: iron-sulfur cluster insertion protein ErpA [Alphaproteobacteria bacterium]